MHNPLALIVIGEKGHLHFAWLCIGNKCFGFHSCWSTCWELLLHYCHRSVVENWLFICMFTGFIRTSANLLFCYEVCICAGGSIIISWMTAFFNAILSTGHCPSDLKCGLIVPIFKPGKPLGVPKSFRPVMLLSVVRKVLTSVITTRCTGFKQTYVREYQAGFRPGHSTTDGVFYTRSLRTRHYRWLELLRCLAGF